MGVNIILFFILIFASEMTEVKSAKILAIFPMPSISHQVVFRPITQELAKRGHEVTVITTDPAFPKGDAPPNLKEIDVHDISYQFWRKSFQENRILDGNSFTFTDLRHVGSLLTSTFEVQLQSPEIKGIFSDKSIKFDLILIESLFRPALAYSFIFKAPVILVSSLGVLLNYHNVMGLHTHPLLYPSSMQKNIYNLTFSEKLGHLYKYYSLAYADYLNEGDENEMLKKNFGPSVPPLSDLYNNIDMLFLNYHPIWADNQPVPPNVLYIGGIYKKPERELPKDLETYLDASKHGVIYFSLGTNVLAGMIPPDKIEIMVKVLSKLPYNVLWKWDKDELPGKSDNIRLSKWYPQSDLLRHPNIKLFITQAGLQSTEEAISAGVPLVAIPMLADQWYNADKYVKHGIGKKLSIETLTADVFRNAVETVINDDSYRKNIRKIRKIMDDQPVSALKNAVWWAEYVMKHGGAKHLRSASANMSYVEYFEIELVLIIMSVVLAALVMVLLTTFIIFKILKSLLRVVTKKKVKTK